MSQREFKTMHFFILAENSDVRNQFHTCHNTAYLQKRTKQKKKMANTLCLSISQKLIHVCDHSESIKFLMI